jgi:hypothetical protein
MREGIGFGRSPKASSPNGPLCQAIGKRTCVSANQGNLLLVIAPHAVFWRENGLRLAGAIIEENGIAFDLPRWSVLNVAELTYIMPTEQPFVPHADYDPDDERFGHDIVCRLTD